MSNDVSRRIPIGPCMLRWGDVRLGSPKSQVSIKYTKDVVLSSLEHAGVAVGSYGIGEKMDIDVSIADMRPEQMRYLYAQAESHVSSTTIHGAGYTSTINYAHWFPETVKFTGTVSVTLAKGKFVSGSIQVFKTDFSNAPTGYVRGTDYTGTASNGHIKRIAAGSIGTQETVFIEYKATATSVGIYVGGQLPSFEAALDITYIDPQGKAATIHIYRAKRKGASDFAIKVAAAFDGFAESFDALADMTKAPGRQFAELIVQK